MKKLFLSVLIVIISCSTWAQLSEPFYPIALINNIDSNGYPDSMGVYCWTKGVVIGVDIDGNAGYSFTIWDGEGINLYNYADVGTYQSTEGDSLLVRGSVNFYNGLTEFTPDSIVLINQGNPIPSATTVVRPEEMNESMPIRILNVQVIDPAQWPTTYSANVQLVTCSGDTIVMRIDTDTDIEENIPSAPSGVFSVTGIGGQYDNSSPYNSGYQIFPMYATDIDTITDYAAPSLVLNEVLSDNVSDTTDENGEHDSWIELHNTSDTPMLLAGLFLSDDAAFPRKYMIPTNSAYAVPAMGYTIIWCDGQPDQGDLHTSFTLNTGGGSVYLNSYDGCESVSAIDYPALGSDQSFGYYPEGSDTLTAFAVATPGAMNEVISPTGNGVVLDDNAVRVYPNPAFVDQSIRFTSKIDYTLFDATGRVIISDRNSDELKLQGFMSGIYYIKTKDTVLRLIVE